MTWRVLIESSVRNPYSQLFIARDREDGRFDVVKPLTLTTFDEGAQIPDAPVIDPRQTEHFLRAMLNAAWDMGMRPDGFMDTRESMRATAAHLQDMRAIAFHKIGAEKP